MRALIAGLLALAGCAGAEPTPQTTAALTPAPPTPQTTAALTPAPPPPPTTTTTTTTAPLRYDVVVDEEFVVTEVVCPAVDVVAEDKGAAAFLVGPVVVEGGCTKLVLDLKQAARRLDDRDRAVVVGEDIVVASPDVWLWHPRPARHGVLQVRVPDGWRAVLPFPTTTDAAGGYVVDASTWSFLSTAVFGKVAARDVEAAGAVFTVVTLPGALRMVRADVDRWLGAAADAVALGNGGSFPFPRVQVVVDPVLAGGVPFGMVQRGGGPQAFLLLGARARVDDVVDDWVAVHELSHLLSPPVGLADTWLGEGLASYHQNVLRARAGLLSEARAWEELRDGFERGAEAAARGPFTLSLRDASARMRAEGRYLQTYWGGAAIVLAVDVALRRCGQGSVDDVVASLRRDQPLVDVRRVPAAEFVARAQKRAGGCADVSGLVADALARPFPDVAALMAELGVARGRLDETAPLAAVRRAISGRPRR